MENNNTTPLWRKLNESRQQGTMEAVQFDSPHKDICIKLSEYKINGQWHFADRVCENFPDIETAIYTSLAVNEFANVVEALEGFVEKLDNHPSPAAKEHYQPLVNRAKELLKRIS